MKNTSLFLAFLLWGLFYCVSSVAQQKVGEFPIGISKPKEAILVSSKQNEWACVTQNSKQIEINFLGADYSFKNKVVITKMKTEKTVEIKGALLDNEFFYVYAFNPKLKTIICKKVARRTGTFTSSIIKVLPANDLLLSVFAMDESFYFLSVPKNTNKLAIIKLNGEVPEEIQYEVQMPTFYAAVSKQNNMVNSKDHSTIAIQEVPSGLDCELAISASPKKLYHNNGIITMTFDEPSTTHLLTFDPTHRLSDYKKLSFKLDKGDVSSQKQGNSFIYQNSLVRGTISPEQLNITVLNLDSMSRTNNFNSYPEEAITIANTPLMEESGYPGSTNEVILKNSNQYFKHVLKGEFAITARSIDAQKVEVKIGSVEKYYANRGGGGPGGFGMPMNVGFGVGMGGMGMGMGGMGMGMGGMGMGMGGMGMGGMGMGMPYGGYPGYGPSYAGSKVTYFKSIFSANDFNHEDGFYQTTSLSKQMDDYKSKVFRNNYPDLITETYSDNKAIMGYYKKNGKRFVLIEFLNQ